MFPATHRFLMLGNHEQLVNRPGTPKPDGKAPDTATTTPAVTPLAINGPSNLNAVASSIELDLGDF